MNAKAQDKRDRHRYLNLLQFRFPITAILSGGHRVSGLFLFLLTPLFILSLDHSLSSEEGYRQLGEWMQHGLVRLGLALVLWAGFHHLFAGIRFLLMDVGIGEQKQPARTSAWLAMIAAIPAALLSWWLLL